MNSKEFRKIIVQQALGGATVEPRCPHAGQCGGCAFQERAYADQVAAKAAALDRIWRESDLQAWRPDPATPLAVVPSPAAYTYRTRMDYVATKGRFGLRMRGRFNYIVELETCHLIPPAGFRAAYAVWQKSRELGIPDYNIRSHEGFLRYVVVRRSPADEFLLAAVTAAGGDAAMMDALAATALAQPGVVGFHWLVNATRTDLSFGEPARHWGAATLAMQAGDHTLHIGPNSFFQNNVHLLPRLIGDVTAATGDGVVADLYGGVGTFALALAPHVERVVSVESVTESSSLARHNSALNGVTNVAVVAAPVEQFLAEQATGAFAAVVADPPRTGLGPVVCNELLRLAPQRIIYVSCNPLTQIDDLRVLLPAYRLTTLYGYDMFPHTPHIEALAVLERA